MGIEMEIDLIAGLIKPKTALNEQATLENPDLQVVDFTALLNDETAAPEAAPPPEEQAKLVVDLPQAVVPNLIPDPTPETTPRADVVSIPVPAIAPDANTTAAPLAPALTFAPVGMKAEPVVSSPNQPMAKASIIHPIAAPVMPERTAQMAEQTAKMAEITPASRERSEILVRPDPQQRPEIKGDLPVSAAAKLQPEPKPPAAGFSPQLIDRAAEPKGLIRQDTPPAETPAPPEKILPKNGAQPPALLTPTFGFTNMEAVTDTPDEVQFGIKIERQSVELTNISRNTPQAAPVASQITAQLPQLLTKAEKQTVELRLDPPELGRVTIHLTTNDQQITAQVVAERVDTIDLMRRHAELLTATLARAGFSEANLSFQQGHGQNGKAEFEQFQNLTELIESEVSTTQAPTLSGQDGRLDIRL